MRIAIVGSGISGLACAHVLRRGHEVTLFEADDRIGGHVNTVDVELAGQRLAIDTGFVVYNETTYPLFTRLLAQLGVDSQPSDMSFSVACERSGCEWSSRGWAGLFAQRRNVLRAPFRRMLRDVQRFNREAPRLLETGDDKVTLGDYLCGAGYSAEFVERYAVPMGAAIWSAPPAEFLRMPALCFVRFFENHRLLQRRPDLSWRVLRGGSRRYVDALAEPLRGRIRTRTPVHALRRVRGGVELRSGSGTVERFERVILAVHSDQALRLLADASDAERGVLGAIRYQENEVTLHTDAALMPGRRRAWASWNYRVPRDGHQRAFVTYHMNRLQGLGCGQDFFVTLNGRDRVDPTAVLARFGMHHPVFDADAIAAQRLHHVIDGARGVHFCGAYWGYGFHEDGVASAVRVCRKLGAEL